MWAGSMEPAHMLVPRWVRIPAFSGIRPARTVHSSTAHGIFPGVSVFHPGNKIVCGNLIRNNIRSPGVPVHAQKMHLDRDDNETTHST